MVVWSAAWSCFIQSDAPLINICCCVAMPLFTFVFLPALTVSGSLYPLLVHSFVTWTVTWLHARLAAAQVLSWTWPLLAYLYKEPSFPSKMETILKTNSVINASNKHSLPSCLKEDEATNCLCYVHRASASSILQCCCNIRLFIVTHKLSLFMEVTLLKKYSKRSIKLWPKFRKLEIRLSHLAWDVLIWILMTTGMRCVWQ